MDNTITPTPKNKSLSAFRSFVLSKSPNMTKAQLDQLDKFVNQKQAEYLLQNGVPVDKLPSGDNLAAAYDTVFKTKSQATPSADLSQPAPETDIKKILGIDTGNATDKKNKDVFNSINNFINNLEKNYQQAGGASFGGGPLARILGTGAGVQGSLGLNDPANVYNRQKRGFVATLKSLTGDVGVMTEQDFQRLAGLVPDLGSTPGEAKTLLNDLRSQIAAKFGGESSKTTINPKDRNSLGIVADMLLGKAINIAKDTGAGITANMTQGKRDISNASASQQAQQLEAQAQQITDPEQKKQLLQQANVLRGQVSQGAQEVSQSFSPDIQQNPLIRSALGATQIASTAEIPALAKGIVTAPKKILSSIFSQGKGNVVRNDAINLAEKTGQKVDGGKIVNAVDKWAEAAKDANPEKIKTINKFVTGIRDRFVEGEGVTPNKLFELWSNAKKGFTAAGTKGASLDASYHRAIRDVVRGELDNIAPGFEKGTQLIKSGLDKTDIAKKLAWMTGGAVATGASTAILLKLLGLRGNQQ